MCLKFLKFEIQILKFPSDLNSLHGNTKFVLVYAIYNFVVDRFFIWRHLEFQILVSSSHILIFFSNKLRWRRAV